MVTYNVVVWYMTGHMDQACLSSNCCGLYCIAVNLIKLGFSFFSNALKYSFYVQLDKTHTGWTTLGAETVSVIFLLKKSLQIMSRIIHVSLPATCRVFDLATISVLYCCFVLRSEEILRVICLFVQL